MTNDLAVALLDALDQEALAALAERLQPHLRGARDSEGLLTTTQLPAWRSPAVEGTRTASCTWSL